MAMTVMDAGCICTLLSNAPYSHRDWLRLAAQIEPCFKVGIVDCPPGVTACELKAAVGAVVPCLASRCLPVCTEQVHRARPPRLSSKRGTMMGGVCKASVRGIGGSIITIMNRLCFVARRPLCQLNVGPARHCPPRPATIVHQKLRIMSLIFLSNPPQFLNHLPPPRSPLPVLFSVLPLLRPDASPKTYQPRCITSQIV